MFPSRKLRVGTTASPPSSPPLLSKTFFKDKKVINFGLPIEFYGDFHGSFHKSLELDKDLSVALLGPRSQR
ncbi:putative peroxidase [Rosa chinensis]|uniref:Putative peroxidase n=1 Tax=Rosa chinensis TaxID=74649 RepID=A0A2P6QRP7_ROSCH|nr:putative peroxidase [Rosa chinensis]